MRCLYCGIRLKINENGPMIEYCPECSVRGERESRQDFHAAQDRGARCMNAGDDHRRPRFVVARSA